MLNTIVIFHLLVNNKVFREYSAPLSFYHSRCTMYIQFQSSTLNVHRTVIQKDYYYKTISVWQQSAISSLKMPICLKIRSHFLTLTVFSTGKMVLMEVWAGSLFNAVVMQKSQEKQSTLPLPQSLKWLFNIICVLSKLRSFKLQAVSGEEKILH